MCNCLGWDIAYYPNDEITIKQHFCRIYGDCGHIDNTLEEASDQVASEYFKLYDWTYNSGNHNDDSIKELLVWLKDQATMWQNRTHKSYLFYSKPGYFDVD